MTLMLFTPIQKNLKQHAEINQPYRNWSADFQYNPWTCFYVSKT